jgi:hypothetical protein
MIPLSLPPGPAGILAVDTQGPPVVLRLVSDLHAQLVPQQATIATLNACELAG